MNQTHTKATVKIRSITPSGTAIIGAIHHFG